MVTDCKVRLWLSAAIPRVAWAPSDSTSLNNGYREREPHDWSHPTVRFLTVVQLVGIPQPPEWQRINAAFIFARADFVDVHGIRGASAMLIGEEQNTTNALSVLPGLGRGQPTQNN